MSSSTGAGYKALARYSTPVDLCRAIIGSLPIPRSAVVLEPHVGEGPWVQALLDSGHPARNIIAADIDPTAHGIALAVAAGCRVYAGDFLRSAPVVPIDWVIGNPPYGEPRPEVECPTCKGTGKLVRKQTSCRRCEGVGRWTPKPRSVVLDHVQRARELVAPQRGGVAYLLRGAFSEARRKFWANPANMPRERIDIDPRPGYDPEQPMKTDSASYAVFWWDLSRPCWTSTWRRLQWRLLDDATDEDDAT